MTRASQPPHDLPGDVADADPVFAARGKQPSRRQDEILLRWIAMRRQGIGAAEIGVGFGVAPEAVRSATNRVLDADVELCGPGVAPAYWDRSSRPKNLPRAAR